MIPENIDYNKLTIFVVFIIVFLSVSILAYNEIEIPSQFMTIVVSLGAAIVGLVTNINKDNT